MSGIELEATKLRECWAVRPRGACGTCGWYPRAWTVVYVKARSAAEAIRKAQGRVFA